MRECTCNACGMEFTVERLDTDKDIMKDGHKVEVMFFTCPKCDEKFIVSVRDEESARLRDNLWSAQQVYQQSFDPKDESKQRIARNEVNYSKRALIVYMNRLKKKYLKELKKRGKQ